MAVYQLLTSWMSVSDMCKITSNQQREGFTIYVIEVVISPYRWMVCRRYSEFRDLHEKLVLKHGISKNLLPPKKIFGNQTELFIQKRQADLELYMQSVIHQIPKLPQLMAEFLDFQHYEIHYIMESLAETLFLGGDKILQSQSFFTVSPLQLHALTERLKLPEPTCTSGNMKNDLGHILDFISQLKFLHIEGSKEPVLRSNIIPNHLSFDLSPFKELLELKIENCSGLQGKLNDLTGLRSSARSLFAHNSLDDLPSFLLGNLVHFSVTDDLAYWPWWIHVHTVDFSHNNINSIDPCIRLLRCLENLDLSHNSILCMENLESLPNLSTLNLSHNRITYLDTLHTRLGNILNLNLSGNAIVNLQGLSRLYSLVFLDLSHNQVTNLIEIGHLASLPCLESLVLKGNPLSVAVDYRAHALVAFGARAGEIILDEVAVTQKELDTVSVLQALQAAREGKLLRRPSHNESSHNKVENSPILYSDPRSIAGVEQEPSEFRQQVAALRRLGGSDWLRLFNHFRKEQDVQQNDLEDDPEVAYPEIKSGLDISSLCEPSVGCYFSNFEIGGNIFLPEWIFSLNISNAAFRLKLQKTLKSIEVQKSQISKNDIPVWSIWGLILWSQMTTCVKLPACIIFYTNRISIFRLDNLLCNDSDCKEKQETTTKEFPEPIMTQLFSIDVTSIMHLYTGPYDRYVEIHSPNSDGLQVVHFFLPDCKEFLEKLQSVYQVNPKVKYSRGEIEEGTRNALVTHSSNIGIKLVTGRAIQVMCCEQVFVMKLEDNVKQCLPRNKASFLIITPELVVLLEETLILPPVVSVMPFKVETVFDVRNDVHSIQMKDSGSSNHVCCCHVQDSNQDYKHQKEKCCLLHELYTCGFWLLVDFEGNSSIKVRFTSREARSRFLEAFLAARNQVN